MGGGEVGGQFYEICHRGVELFFFVVFDADDVQGVFFQFLFYEFKEFTVVFKGTGHAFIVLAECVVRDREGDLDGYGFVGVVVAVVEALVHFHARAVCQAPENGVVSHYIEEEYRKQEDGEGSFQSFAGNLLYVVYRNNSKFQNPLFQFSHYEVAG